MYGKKLILIISIAGLCLGFLLKLFCPSETPEKVVERYLEINCTALNQGAVSDKELRWITAHYLSPYYGNLSIKRTKNYTKTRKSYRESNSDIRQEIRQIKVLSQSEDTAHISAEISTKILEDNYWTDHIGVILYLLKREDNVWKIDHIGE